MSPSELKYQVESHGNEPHFFTRRTMQFFGDSMRNYGVRSKVLVTDYEGVQHECFELYRKRPVKHGLDSSAYFDAVSFKRRFDAK
jgi:hypothetical protein